MNKQKGFTIIELIVVIAIIAVLAGIVLVNVTSYINKGKDAAVEGNLSSILTNAAQYFDANGNYTSVCSNATVAAAMAASNTASGATATCTVKADNTAFCACSVMKTAANTFCVDSTGTKKLYTNTSSCATDCPAAGACL